MDEVPNILRSNKTDIDKIQDISKIKGMTLKTGETFVSNINKFIMFLNNTGLDYKLNTVKNIEKNEKNITHPLYKKVIVLTGTSDKKIMNYLKEVGAILGSNVSSNTTFVVAKTVNDDTSKLDDARKMNIPIISVQYFISSYVKD